MYRMIFLLMLAVSVASCNPTRVVKTLEKGEQRVMASFGGPGIIFSGAPMPLPLTSVGYAYGLDTGLTLTGNFHTTSLLFGNLQADMALGIRVYEDEQQRFGITAIPGLNLIYGLRGSDFRAYPQLEGIGWWKYGTKNHFLYGGAGTWVELVREKAHGEPQLNELLPYVTLGHQFSGDKWIWQVEARYLGFNQSNEDIVVTYLGPFSTGTTGLYVGLSRTIGKR